MCVVYTNKKEEVFFPIPLFERFYLDEICRTIVSSKLTPVRASIMIKAQVRFKTDLAFFVKEIVKQFDSNELKHCISRSVSNTTLLEAVYDRLVYLGLRNLHLGNISTQFQSYDPKTQTLKGKNDKK